MLNPDTIETRDQLSRALTALREQAGLTVRELARRADIRAATLGGYLSGRHVPGVAAGRSLRALLAACGVSDDAEVERWLAAVARVRSGSDGRTRSTSAADSAASDPAGPALVPDLPAPRPPYRGLARFEAGDAGLFHGRDEATRALLAAVDALLDDPGPSGGMLAVIGASGAGKSSLLRAGLAAAAGRLDGDRPLRFTVTTPGEPAPAPPAAGETGVLVLDQAEELFTGFDADARAAYLRELDHGAWTVVVLGLRADFFEAAAREPMLQPALAHAQFLVVAMDADELRAAIVGPADACGVAIDDPLVDLVLADVAPLGLADGTGVAHDAGALPLMSHALLATWQQALARGDARRLTVADYRATGGLRAAVQRSAEDVYETLTPAQRELARRLFLRLVHLDGDTAVTRRRIDLDELDRLGAGTVDTGTGSGAGTVDIDAGIGAPAEADADTLDIVARFVDRRLLTVGEGWLEIAHEALLRAWPRLREWVDADREGLRVHRRITDGANDWAAAGEDAAVLPRGGRLETAAGWAADPDHRAAMNDLERRFVRAAVDRQHRERHRERTRRRRLRQLFAVVAALAVVATVLAVVALQSRQRAEGARLAAGVARSKALSRSVAAAAEDLRGDDPALAQQLAVAAFRISPTGAARGAVIDQSAQPTVTRVVDGAIGPTALAASSAARLLAVGNAQTGAVALYTPRAGRAPLRRGVVPGVRGDTVFALGFGGDGRYLVTGGESRSVRVWEVARPARPTPAWTVPADFAGDTQTAAVSPDGRLLVAGSVGAAASGGGAAGSPVLAWRLGPDGAVAVPVPALPAGVEVQGLTFSADGDRLAVVGTGGLIRVWTVSGDRVQPSRTLTDPDGATVNCAALDATGTQLYTGDRIGTVQAWDLAGTSTRPVHSVHDDTSGQINALALSADGGALLAGASDDTLHQWSTTTWAQTFLTDNPGPVTGVGYVGRELASTTTDGALRLVTPAASGLTLPGPVFALGFSRSGDRLIAADNSSDGPGLVRLWDTAGSRIRPVAQLRFPAPAAGVDGTGAISPDGRIVAAGNGVGQVQLWDVSDTSHPVAIGRPFAAMSALVESLAFSPDGRTLAVGGDDHDVHLWDVADPARPRALSTVTTPNLVLNVAISPNGRLVAAADADDAVHVFGITDPTHPVTFPALRGFASYVWGVAFSPDSTRLAGTGADQTTRVFDVADPRRPRQLGHTLVGPTDYVFGAAFSPDGKQLAVASNDRTVRLYPADASAAVPTATLRANGSNLFVVAYRPDGRQLLGAGRSGVVTAWSTDLRSYVRGLCRAAGSPITREEWALYVGGARYDPPCR